ncbi:MAG: hypothetical protein RLZZ200_176 [Pseudomonadota bacterium]|jgi:RND family efflux transporter MFP subunit
MSPIEVRPSRSGKVHHPALVVLVTALALAGCGKPAAQADKAAGAPPVAAMTVTTATILSAPVARSVDATGSVQAWQEVVIGAEVGGYRVAALNVDVGSHVKRGQVLVQLSSDLLEAEVRSRRSALKSAEARAANADAALRRGQAVAATGALSKANIDQLQADQIAALAQVETARADLSTSELRLKYTQVTAPDDGVVSSRTVSVGQIAQAGAEMLRMVRQGRVEWRAEVPEARLSLVKPGQPVTLTTADGSQVQGTVRTVAPTVAVANRTALVYVDVPANSVRPGMFARGSIGVGKGNAMLVPVQSVVMQDGYAYVFVLKDQNVVERRLVKLANLHGESMEVVSGVKDGDVVAVKGAGFLKDRDTVQVVK